MPNRRCKNKKKLNEKQKDEFFFPDVAWVRRVHSRNVVGDWMSEACIGLFFFWIIGFFLFVM